MRFSLLALVITLFCTPDNSHAQLVIHRSNQIPVFYEGDLLDAAWAAGINSSQWSTIDLNLDGHMDLFIYDRSSKQIHNFIKDPVTGAYELTFDYLNSFPVMDDWILLRDFNCDGKNDIFTSRTGGIRVFENTSENGILSFALRVDVLKALYDFGTAPYYSNIYMNSIDIPNIRDVDGDGDLDIQTFTQSSTTIELHMNKAIDNGNCDSLWFELENRCYANIGENAVNSDIVIDPVFTEEEVCAFNVPDPGDIPEGIKSGGLHAGSCLCSFHADDNGQQDLIIGDITNPHVNLVYIDDMGDEPDIATAVEVNFPQGDVPIDIHVFNCGYTEDLNNDGTTDLMITPTNPTESEDRASCWLYENVGSDNDYEPQLINTAFMQEDMIDVGTNTYPRALDYNADGLLDLVIGSRGKYQDGGLYDEKVWLLENTGTADAPEFTYVTDNFAGLADLGINIYLVPCFGDIDNDGDIDMVLGENSGTLLVFTNDAGPGNPVDFNSAYSIIQDDDNDDLDVGGNPVPQLFDLDQDGLLDLLVGERNGNINFLRNEGSTTNYDFVLANDSIGNIVTDLDGNLIGYCAPWFYLDEAGNVDVLIGNEGGTVFDVQDVTADNDATWVIADSSAFGIYNGIRSCPLVIDIDSDGLPDVFNGNYSGGLGLYMDGEFPNALNEYPSVLDFSIFPNPSKDIITIKQEGNVMTGVIRITDGLGRTIMRRTVQAETSVNLDVSALSEGLYHIHLFNGDTPVVRPFIKQ